VAYYTSWNNRRNDWVRSQLGPEPAAPVYGSGEYAGDLIRAGEPGWDEYQRKANELSQGPGFLQYAAQTWGPEAAQQAAEAFQSHSSSIDRTNKIGKMAALGTIGAAGLGAGLTAAGVIGGGSGVLSTGLGATSFPVAPGAVETSALGAGTVSGGSGFMGAGIPGAAAAAAPAVVGGAPVAASGFMSGLAQYAPLISAGAGVANSLFGGPDMPDAPNYSALLDQQTAAQNALYDKLLANSRVNQTGPDGAQTWSKGPDGQWTLNTTLNPTQQGLYNQQQGISGDLLTGADNALSQPLSMAGVPGMNYGTTDANGMPNYNQTVADAYYRQGTRYLDPQIAQDQTLLESRLGQQGFVPGTPAYIQAMQNFMDTKNRAYGSARDFATTQGFTTGLENAKFGNQARGQSLAEMLALRNQPLNELNAFRSGSQVSTPQWNAQYSTPQQQAPDVVGTATQGYNSGLGQYNAGVAQNQNTTNNLFGLAGTMMNGKYNLFTGMGG
jgi:hypothetical protein